MEEKDVFSNVVRATRHFVEDRPTLLMPSKGLEFRYMAAGKITMETVIFQQPTGMQNAKNG
jgi:hypothetical protein